MDAQQGQHQIWVLNPTQKILQGSTNKESPKEKITDAAYKINTQSHEKMGSKETKTTSTKPTTNNNTCVVLQT